MVFDILGNGATVRGVRVPHTAQRHTQTEKVRVMKRYRVYSEVDEISSCYDLLADEAHDGAWVKWEDVERLLADTRALRSALATVCGQCADAVRERDGAIDALHAVARLVGEAGDIAQQRIDEIGDGEYEGGAEP